MERIQEDMFVVRRTSTGRGYVIRRRAMPRGRRCIWEVCGESGGAFGTFTTLPGARRWALAH